MVLRLGRLYKLYYLYNAGLGGGSSLVSICLLFSDAVCSDQGEFVSSPFSLPLFSFPFLYLFLLLNISFIRFVCFSWWNE